MSDGIDILKELALAIRNATKSGENTAERVGRTFVGIVDILSKINPDSLDEKYLRKDIPDSTQFLLSLLGGVIIKRLARFGDFVTGVSGGMIDEKGDMEMKSGYFRKRLFVPELAFNRLTYFKGRAVLSPGGGCKIKSYVKNEDGSFTVTPDLTDADALSQFVDDILSAFFTTKNSDGKLTGFAQMQFRVTEADYDAKTFKMVNRPGQNYEPGEEMILAQTGNFTDEDRQTYILFDTVDGNNCITYFDKANTWDPEPAQMPAWFGKKKGMTVQGINADNYSAVLQNIIMTGLIFQTDEITGEDVRVPIWKGEWKAGKYGYFNEVSHNGSRYLCVNPDGTEQEPGTGVDWMVTVQKGEDGAPGLSVVGGGHWEASKTPYAANTLVTLANCVFLSKVETSNPPIRISRFKSGNYRRKKDGGYILAGSSLDWEVHSDWTMLLDGRELKGTSITFLGSFASAPSNPKEGNSYYNTTDKCTYVYQGGIWMLMVSDGKDGRDYEYIYTRNNSIGIIPEKPDSQQQDDYVPEGWTADYLGVSEEYQVEWGCKRTKRDGIWSEWSTPAVVHRWAKDGADGKPGTDGVSVNPRGRWEASQVPYYKNDLVNFAYGTFVALRQTNNPPYPISRFKSGNYRRKKDGGYILAGAGGTLNLDWQVVTPPYYPGSYWLDCPVSSIGISSVGTPSPSSVLVTCKMNLHNKVQLCGDFFLAARKYNGSWIAHVSPIKSYELSVPATAGYTQFAVRAYRTSSDASSWNDNYICEKGIGVSVDGSAGADAAFMYDNGPWESGKTYVWNDTRRDKVIHPFDGVYYNFLVKNKGASVTAAPTSANGDSNWEAMNKLINIATDSLFADGANVASFLFKNGVLRSQDETDGVANIIMNGKTGYFHCSKADITGTINAIGGNFKNVTVQGTFRTKESGDRIELSTDTNTFSFIGSNNVHYMELFFNISGSTKSARMTLHDDYGNVTTLSPGTFNLDFNFSGVPADDNGETLTTLNYGLQIYNRTKDRLVFISPRKLQFNEGGIIYQGYTGTAEYVPPNGYSKTLYFKNGILYKIG